MPSSSCTSNPIFTLACCSCLRSRVVYDESRKSLRAAKSLQRMARSLSKAVDSHVAKLKQAVVPASRSYGLSSLPNEIIVRVINLVGQRDFSDPRKLRNTIWTFFEVPIFNACVTDAMPLLKRCKESPSRHYGSLPPSYPDVPLEEIFLTEHHRYSTREVTGSLGACRSLQHLEISTQFSVADLRKNLGASPDVCLPLLTSLRVSNERQIWTHEALQVILSKLEMPKLLHITANLHCIKENLEEGGDDIFSSVFGARVYPLVTTFELEEVSFGYNSVISYIDVQYVFRQMPALTSLLLGSFGIVDYVWPAVYNEEEPYYPVNLRFLRVEFDDTISLQSSRAYGSNPTFVLEELVCDEVLIQEVAVVTRQPEVFDAIQAIFPDAQWVSDRSILEDEDPGRDAPPMHDTFS